MDLNKFHLLSNKKILVLGSIIIFIIQRGFFIVRLFAKVMLFFTIALLPTAKYAVWPLS